MGFMKNNFLKLNASKTQVMFCGSPSMLSLYSQRFQELAKALNIPDTSVLRSGKTLGAVLDEELKFDKMISDVCQAAYCKLNELKSMRNSIGEDLRLSLVKCYILSKLDYCNFLYANATNKQLKPLQKCLNAGMRYIFSIRRSQHVTPYLKRAHVLPIRFRIIYKLCMYVYKINNGLAPEYLNSLVTKRETSRQLRSTMDETLVATHYEPSTIAFRMCSEWNQLPRELREAPSIDSFKKYLKTHLFRRAFD